MLGLKYVLWTIVEMWGRHEVDEGFESQQIKTHERWENSNDLK